MNRDRDRNQFTVDNNTIRKYLQKRRRDRSIPPLQEWNTSNVTNMSGLFANVRNSFNDDEDDISEWDVSNVTDMSYMFSECKRFNGDLSAWNTSKVTNMSYMFYNCASFDSDLSEWDIQNVKDMSYMFYGCEELSYVGKIKHFWQIPSDAITDEMYEGTPDTTYFPYEDDEDVDEEVDPRLAKVGDEDDAEAYQQYKQELLRTIHTPSRSHFEFIPTYETAEPSSSSSSNPAILFIANHGAFEINNQLQYIAFDCPVQQLIRFNHAPRGTCAWSNIPKRYNNYMYIKHALERNDAHLLEQLKHFGQSVYETCSMKKDYHAEQEVPVQKYGRNMCHNLEKSNQVVVNQLGDTILNKIFTADMEFPHIAGIMIVKPVSFLLPRLFDSVVSDDFMWQSLVNDVERATWPIGKYDMLTKSIHYEKDTDLLACPYFQLYMKLLDASVSRKLHEKSEIVTASNTCIDVINNIMTNTVLKATNKPIVKTATTYDLCSYFQNVGKLVLLDFSCSVFEINESELRSMSKTRKYELVNRNLIQSYDRGLFAYQHKSYDNNFPLGGKKKKTRRKNSRKGMKPRKRKTIKCSMHWQHRTKCARK